MSKCVFEISFPSFQLDFSNWQRHNGGRFFYAFRIVRTARWWGARSKSKA